MKDVLFYYIRRNEKVKEFLAPFYKGYIYCKEYNRNKCYAIGAIKKLTVRGRYNSKTYLVFLRTYT